MNETKIYYISTNGYDMLVVDDGERRWYLNNEYAEAPRDEDGQYIDLDAFLKSTEDWSSWNQTDATVEEIIYNDENTAEGDKTKILAELTL